MNEDRWGYITNREAVIEFIRRICLRDGSEPAAYLVGAATALQLDNNYITEAPFKLLGRTLFDAQEVPEGEIIAMSADALKQVLADGKMGILPVETLGLNPDNNPEIVRATLPVPPPAPLI